MLVFKFGPSNSEDLPIQHIFVDLKAFFWVHQTPVCEPVVLFGEGSATR